jgi:hypothetical protein
MLISLHKQATTVPKIRAAIQASSGPAWLVAERYGISEQPVWKWRGRDIFHERSHAPHCLQTTLTPAQEAVAVALRKALLLPHFDLLAVVREFLNPDVSRSGLGDGLVAGRCRSVQPDTVSFKLNSSGLATPARCGGASAASSTRRKQAHQGTGDDDRTFH